MHGGKASVLMTSYQGSTLSYTAAWFGERKPQVAKYITGWLPAARHYGGEISHVCILKQQNSGNYTTILYKLTKTSNQIFSDGMSSSIVLMVLAPLKHFFHGPQPLRHCNRCFRLRGLRACGGCFNEN